jgi:hypothetical protein
MLAVAEREPIGEALPVQAARTGVIQPSETQPLAVSPLSVSPSFSFLVP